MIIAYRYGKLSILQPIISIGYVFALLLSFFILIEEINIFNYCGIIIVIIGVFLLGLSDA